MSYAYVGSAALGSSKAAATITATVVDLTGADLGVQPTRDVINLGGGVFGVSISDMPDAQSGWVLVKEGSTVLTALGVNPRETENADVKTSTRGTGTSTYAGGDTSGTTTLLSRLTSGRAILLDNMDAAVTTRAPAATALTNATWTDARAGFLDAAISGVSTYAGGDTAGTTTLLARLTSGRALLLDNLDAAVSTRATPAQVNAEADAALADVGLTTTVTGRIDAAITTRAAASTSLTNATWTDAKAAFLDAAISSVSTGGVSAEDIATAVRSELATELARIDAAVSTRSTYAGADTSGTTTLLGRLTAPRAALLDNLDAAVSTRASASTALSTAVWTNTKAAFLDAAVSTAGGGTVQLDLAQTGLTPRALDSVADSALTVGDALVAALAGAAGKESVASTAYVVKTPSTGTVIRTFALTLDGDGLPVARN